jgi:hypothetical protein
MTKLHGKCIKREMTVGGLRRPLVIELDERTQAEGGSMKIIGLKSICCGEAVSQRNKYANVKTPREWGDEIYICRGCRKPCEGYFVALIPRMTVGEHDYTRRNDL